LFVGDIPKTRNAKVMRRIVRAAYLGDKLGDTSALENPASLEEIKGTAPGLAGRARHSVRATMDANERLWTRMNGCGRE
jgi:hypothetical protein